MPKSTAVETETKTKLGTATKISLGFMLATGLISVGLFAFAGLYTLIVNHFGQPAVISATNPATSVTQDVNDNTNENLNTNTDLNFTTD